MSSPSDNDAPVQYLSRKAAVAYLRSKGCPIELRTLNYYACKQCKRKIGPPFIKVGYIINYRKDDLDRWLDDRLQRIGE